MQSEITKSTLIQSNVYVLIVASSSECR